jgi:photosystem II stability/assembly factor-like uncharacterized protein
LKQLTAEEDMKSILICTSLLFWSLLLINGQADDNVWTGHGPDGGSVQTIALNPFDSRQILIGTVEDGIYKTNDGGENWYPIGEGFSVPTIREIVFHPLAPDTIYAATVKGMYKSADMALTWTLMIPPWGVLNEYRCLRVHPFFPNIIYAGGPSVKWRSTDAGGTWQAMQIPLESGMQAIIIDPIEHNLVYAVEETPWHCIYRSTDLGDTWESIQNDMDTISFGRDLAIDPANNNILYMARTDIFESGGQILLKSTNRGQNWVDISPDSLLVPEILDVEVSPFNSNHVFIATRTDGVLVSYDGGENWAPRNNGIRNLAPKIIYFDIPSQIIYLGTYFDGIYKSMDMGESWQRISSNINAAQCIDLTLSQRTPGDVLVAAINGLFKSRDFGQSWRLIDLGFHPLEIVSGIEIDKYTENRYYASTFASEANFDHSGFYVSEDSGQTWQIKSAGLPIGTTFTGFDISYSEQGNKIFLVSESGVYFSTDPDQGWTFCSQCNIFEYCSAVRASPVNPRIVAVGSISNRIIVSEDRGQTWSETSPLPGTSGSYVLDLAFDSMDDSTLYAASAYAGLYKTTDLGESWSDISLDLPRSSYFLISGIKVNPLNNQNVYVYDSFYGVYQSDDGGMTWRSYNIGMDTTISAGIIEMAAADTNQIYFASNLRSTWSIHRTLTDVEDDDPNLPQSVSLSAYPTPFNAATTIEFALPHDAFMNLNVYDIQGRRVATLIEGANAAGYHRVTWDAGAIPSGIYFIRLSASEFAKTIKATLLK